jgi:hypothetical protein
VIVTLQFHHCLEAHLTANYSDHRNVSQPQMLELFYSSPAILIGPQKAESENQTLLPQCRRSHPNLQRVASLTGHVRFTNEAPQSLVESLSYAHYARPFKNPNYTKNANRRAKSAKQVIGAEREREKLGREKLKAQGMDIDWTEDPEAISCTFAQHLLSILLTDWL